MMRLLRSLFLPKTIYKINSPINGEIKVVERFGRRSIKVSGMEQSGAMVEKIWEEAIKNLPTTNYKLPITNVLILGLGGGSAVKVINKYCPQAKILGIEIDPAMIELGRRYLGLLEYQNVEIKIHDAFEWIKNFCLNDSNHLKRFNLILVDLYLGKKIPKKLDDDKFLKNVKRILSKNGVAIFNRLRGRGKEFELNLFFDKLKKTFKNVKVVKPLVNQLFICL